LNPIVEVLDARVEQLDSRVELWKPKLQLLSLNSNDFAENVPVPSKNVGDEVTRLKLKKS
jgi:hypothetical protein